MNLGGKHPPIRALEEDDLSRMYQDYAFDRLVAQNIPLAARYDVLCLIKTIRDNNPSEGDPETGEG